MPLVGGICNFKICIENYDDEEFVSMPNSKRLIPKDMFIVGYASQINAGTLLNDTRTHNFW